MGNGKGRRRTATHGAGLRRLGLTLCMSGLALSGWGLLGPAATVGLAAPSASGCAHGQGHDPAACPGGAAGSVSSSSLSSSASTSTSATGGGTAGGPSTSSGAAAPSAGIGSALSTIAAPAVNSGGSGHTGPGDKNAGDVWLDNVGQPAGPGHEMDPHLACQDINLWGAGLADGGGTYTIDGWRPSGGGAGNQAWPGTRGAPGNAAWSASVSSRSPQVISVISVKTLIAHANADGDKPHPIQGYHFKLQFSQDPQKHKTFWVRCDPPVVAVATPTPAPTPTPTPKTSTPTPTPASTPAPTPTSGVLPTATPGLHGEVQALSTPNTGSNLPLGLGLLLTLGGAATLAVSRRRPRRD